MTTRQFEARALRNAENLMKEDKKTFQFFLYLVSLIVKSGLLEKFIEFLISSLPLRRTDEADD